MQIQSDTLVYTTSCRLIQVQNPILKDTLWANAAYVCLSRAAAAHRPGTAKKS